MGGERVHRQEDGSEVRDELRLEALGSPDYRSMRGEDWVDLDDFRGVFHTDVCVGNQCIT